MPRLGGDGDPNPPPITTKVNYRENGEERRTLLFLIDKILLINKALFIRSTEVFFFFFCRQKTPVMSLRISLHF